MIIIIMMHLFVLTFFYVLLTSPPSRRVTSSCSCVLVQTVPLLSRCRSPLRAGYSVAAAVKSSGRTHAHKKNMCFVLVSSANVTLCILSLLSPFLCLSFKCRQMYHAPTDCATIRKWLTKCADDSETANYISAHTKDV